MPVNSYSKLVEAITKEKLWEFESVHITQLQAMISKYLSNDAKRIKSHMETLKLHGLIEEIALNQYKVRLP